jgi:hypothetical protein
LNLAADAEQLLRFWIKLPAAPGTVTLTAAAEANGQPLPDAATRLDINVAPAPDLNTVRAQISALIQAGHPDHKALDQAGKYLDQALKKPGDREAVDKVLKATDALLRLTDPQIVAVRRLLDQWLRRAAQGD